MDFGIATVPVITIIVFVIGLAAKNIPAVGDKWIPVICAGVGVVLGLVGMKVIPDFPATDILSAAAVGIVSGLAATGAHQVGKQLISKNNTSDTTDEVSKDA